MPELVDFTYSRDATIASIRDYYKFLTQLYLDPSFVVEPPAGGWEHITTKSATLDKSKEVIELLKRLPYIRWTLNDTRDAEGAPDCKFADWQDIFRRASDRSTIRLGSEDAAISDYVPKHVVGLTCGGIGNPRFLLDVKLGTIMWYKSPGGLSDHAHYEVVEDDPYDYCSTEEEAEWREDGETWSIQDFFEEMKFQFRNLNFIPLSPRKVVHVWKTAPEDYRAMLAGVQEIYRSHGWPQLGQYNKTACLEAVAQFLNENYPQYVP